jgi:uncharacterized BrkB/YihY/UPF0761 family membrane protein
MSVWLGKLTPAVQTRVVRGVQLALEVHLKSREDQVSVYAAALTYNGFLSILPLALVGLSIAGFMVGSIAAIFGILIFLRLAMWLFLYGARSRRSCGTRSGGAQARSISGATACSPAMLTARNSSSGSPIEASTS